VDSETLGRATEHSGGPVAGEGDVCSDRAAPAPASPSLLVAADNTPLPPPSLHSCFLSDIQAMPPTEQPWLTRSLSHSHPHSVTSTSSLTTHPPLTCSPCLPVSSPALLTHSPTQPPTRALCHSPLSLPSLALTCSPCLPVSSPWPSCSF
jgi:hypothetical protein